MRFKVGDVVETGEQLLELQPGMQPPKAKVVAVQETKASTYTIELLENGGRTYTYIQNRMWAKAGEPPGLCEIDI